jgi:plastocyanin
MMAVDIRNFSFVPQSIAVQKGARIKFTNNDSVNHTVTGSAFDSGVIQPGESYVLDTSNLASGTYDYICTIHPNMKGAITIQ